MARGVGVLGSESGTKGVHVTDRAAVVLNGELPRDGQEGGLSEEILLVVDLSLLDRDDLLDRSLFDFLFLLATLLLLLLLLLLGDGLLGLILFVFLADVF